MNKNEFRAMMAKHGETYEDCAKVVGCVLSTFSNKVNEQNGSGFTQPEIMALKEHWQLTADEVDRIFFQR